MDFDDYDSYAPIAPALPPARRRRAPSTATLAACTVAVALGGIAAVALR